MCVMSVCSHVVTESVENEACPASCNSMPPLAVELMAEKAACLVIGHAEVLHVFRCQLMGAQVAEAAEVRGCFPKGANDRAEHATFRAIFEQRACEWSAFAR